MNCHGNRIIYSRRRVSSRTISQLQFIKVVISVLVLYSIVYYNQGETKMKRHRCPPGKLLVEVTSPKVCGASPKLNGDIFRKASEM